MFGDAVRYIGDEEKFLNKFEFHVKECVKDDIKDGIRRALRESKKTII